MPKTKSVNKQVRLDGVRLSFPHLFAADAFNGGKPRYSASLLMDKGSPAYEAAAAAVKAVLAEAFPGKKLPADKIALRDGAEKDFGGYGEGVWYLSASAPENRPPQLFDRYAERLTSDDGTLYAGCYVNAIVEIWAQDNEYGKRVNAKLLGVQFAKDGEAFGATAPDLSNEFSPVENDAFDDDETPF